MEMLWKKYDNSSADLSEYQRFMPLFLQIYAEEDKKT
jgi:hypothetical protein